MAAKGTFYPPRSSFIASLSGSCPRCGEGCMFAGLLAIADRCAACGHDLRGHDAGDGPAVFVILIVGALMMVVVFWLEFTFAPPFWVHAAVAVPLVSVCSIGLLRLMKGWLVAQQYRHRSTALEP
jgi:uncharacterized protein (DUF983 family)